MRKLMNLFAALLITIAAVSCNKNDILPDNNNTDEDIITLSATISNNATKTVLGEKTDNQYPVLWSRDDEIAVIQDSKIYKFVLYEGHGTNSGMFKLAEEESEGFDATKELKAFYPYSGVSLSSEKITYVVPTSQQYMENSFAIGASPMAAVADNAQDGLHFINLFGAVKIQMKGAEGETISKLVIGSNNILAGMATLSDGPSITMPTDDAASNITLNFATPIDISQTVEFLVPIPEGNHILAFVATTNNGAYYKRTTSRKTVTSGNIIKMPLIDLGAENSKTREEMSIVYPEDNKNGIFIGRNVWANVNCGYDPTNYQWGKLYQWGRKDGCGYNDGSTYQENIIQTFQDGQFNWDGTGICAPDKYIFYRSASNTYHWITGDGANNNAMWNAGDNLNPQKTAYDPCPEGWRIPSSDELLMLRKNLSPMVEVNSQKGRWCSGTVAYEEQMSSMVFLSMAGRRYNNVDGFTDRNIQGTYWSSQYNGSFYFDAGTWGYYNASRSQGLSVRCVKE